MSSDSDFKHSENRRKLRQQAIDRDDYNNEMNGAEVRRIARFGLANARHQHIEQKKKQRSQLEMLLNNAAYRLACEAAMESLNRAEMAVYGALVKAGDVLAGANKTHQDIQDRASTLPDGVKVYRSEDGSIYTADNRKLTEEEAASIHWNEDAPAWEEAQRAVKNREQAQQEMDRLLIFDDEVRHWRERIQDEENPLTLDELNELTKRVDEMRQETNAPNPQSSSYKIKDAGVSIAIPDLDL